MENRPVVYYQTDPRWKNEPYALPGETSTIGSAGCGPTAMAMVLATWCDKSVTPLTECKWSLANGCKALHQGTYYSYIPKAGKRYGLRCYQLNASSIYGNASSIFHDEAKNAITDGHLIIACMGKGLWTSSGHYVLVWKINGNVVYINDPASSRVERTNGNYSVFKRQVKYYFVIEHPKGVEPEMSNLEIQNLVDERIKSAISKAKTEIIDELRKMIPVTVIYDSIDDVPEWGKKAVQRRLNSGSLKGDEHGRLRLTVDMVRNWAIYDRDKEMQAIGLD